MANENLVLNVKFNDGPLTRGFKKVTGLVTGLTKIYKKQGDTFAKAMTEKDMEMKREAKSYDTLLKLSKKLEQTERSLLTAHGKDEQRLRKRLDLYERSYEKAVRGASDYAKALEIARKATKKLHDEEESRKFEKVAEVAGFSKKDMGEDLADGFVSALDSLGGGSLKGLAGGFLKMLGAGAKGAGGGILRGAAAGAEGGKMPGGMSKAVVGMVGTLSKLGPILSAVGSAVVGIVKLFLDAESAAKDFNKEVLSTAGTAGFLQKNMGATGMAAAELKGTLKEIYDSATDIKGNWNWGINKEQHAAVINSLTAEGVRLDKLKDSFDEVAKGTSKSEGYVKNWGTMVQMSVGYSRAFGISLGEITQFQGEMMTETGMNFDMMQSGFETMLDSVKEAGIGTNKFFAQIREIAADLNLFNLRMGDAAKLMGKLDKTMNPRKASEFFRNITQMFKGMGLIERTKSTLLAGKGTTKDLLQKDLAGKIEGLAADIDSKLGAGMGEDLKKVISNPKKLKQWMAHLDATDQAKSAKLDGATRGALLDAARMSDKLQKGGLVDVASALKDASPITAIDHLENVSKKMFGKSMEDLTDVQRIAFESLTGVNDEQVDQMYKFKASLEQTRDTLAEKLKTGADLTAEELKQLHKMGINEKDADAAAKVEGTDARKFYDFMDKSQQDALKEGAKMMDYQKETASFQTSLLSRIDTLVDFLMNQVYNVFMGIWDTISSIPGVGGNAKKQIESEKTQKELLKAGNKDVVDAVTAAGGDFEKARQAIIMNTAVGRDFGKSLESGSARMAELEKKKAGAGSPQEVAAIQKEINDVFIKNKSATDQMVLSLQGIASNGKEMYKINEAAKDAGITNNEQIEKLREALATGKGAAGAMAASGLTEEEFGKFLAKAEWKVDPIALAKSMASFTRVNGASPSAQQQAAKKTEGPPADAAKPATPGAPVEPTKPTAEKPLTPDVVQKSAEETQVATKDQFDQLTRDVRQKSKGFAMNGPFLKNSYGPQIEDSVYNATSKALFEYWLLQQADKGDVEEALKRGANFRDIGPGLLKAAQTGASAKDALAGMKAPGNAEGGLVMRPAPGEYMASVKPGEQIIPVGGGGGGTTKVVIELKGDMLQQIMRATALNTIAENDRAQARR